MVATVERADGNREALRIPQSFALRAGDRLILGGCREGARAYLAVRGGWRTPIAMGSRSAEIPRRAGGILPAEPGVIAVRRPRDVPSFAFDEAPIRVIDGPDAHLVADWGSLAIRLGSNSDRMGLRLEGQAPTMVEEANRPSAPVAPGAVQVAGGAVLILGVAGGTMGGYPLVAHVVSADLGRLGQARPGDPIRLLRVAIDEARALDGEARKLRAARDLLIRAAASDDGPLGTH